MSGSPIAARAAVGPIPLERVRRLSAEGKHVRVFEAGGQHLIRESLAELEARLDPARFVRVHRGDIVERVASISGQDKRPRQRSWVCETV